MYEPRYSSTMVPFGTIVRTMAIARARTRTLWYAYTSHTRTRYVHVYEYQYLTMVPIGTNRYLVPAAWECLFYFETYTRIYRYTVYV